MSSSDDSTYKPRAGNRITSVVTRGGDGGTTSLVGGFRVPKDDPRIEAYGTSDELQVAIGIARDELFKLIPSESASQESPGATLTILYQHLGYIQNLLFTFNTDLATRVSDRWPGMPLPTEDDLLYLENLVAVCNQPLPPLKDFVLPGGHAAVTALHLCRVIARRTERQVEHLARQEPVGELTRPFINRMSDVFFVLSRRVSFEIQRLGIPQQEIIWQREMPTPPLPDSI
jgi:cob(I)alamin adenosyltransferase